MKRITIEFDNDLQIEYKGAFSDESPALIFHDSETGEVARLEGLQIVDESRDDDVIWFEVPEAE
ncbi:hypothetical protein AB0F25_30360 [Streptomyces wedmorensis]|uniref:hypothetical protein n=1 Tax=Streptomyces wedmorensis TaxID=43759 RepID=UPI0034192484